MKKAFLIIIAFSILKKTQCALQKTHNKPIAQALKLDLSEENDQNTPYFYYQHDEDSSLPKKEIISLKKKCIGDSTYKLQIFQDSFFSLLQYGNLESTENRGFESFSEANNTYIQTYTFTKKSKFICDTFKTKILSLGCFFKHESISKEDKNTVAEIVLTHPIKWAAHTLESALNIINKNQLKSTLKQHLIEKICNMLSSKNITYDEIARFIHSPYDYYFFDSLTYKKDFESIKKKIFWEVTAKIEPKQLSFENQEKVLVKDAFAYLMSSSYEIEKIQNFIKLLSLAIYQKYNSWKFNPWEAMYCLSIKMKQTDNQ